MNWYKDTNPDNQIAGQSYLQTCTLMSRRKLAAHKFLLVMDGDHVSIGLRTGEVSMFRPDVNYLRFESQELFLKFADAVATARALVKSSNVPHDNPFLFGYPDKNFVKSLQDDSRNYEMGCK